MPFMSQSWMSHPVTSALFYSLGVSQEAQPTLKGRGIRFHLLEKKNVNDFVHLFQNHHRES